MSHKMALATVDQRTVPFSFAEVVHGVFTRYPNPLARHVKTTDIVQAFQVTEDGDLEGKAFTLKTNPMPTFMSKWKAQLSYNGSPVVGLVEEYLINLKDQALHHLSRNVSSREYLRTHERVTYTGLAPQDSAIHVMIQKEMACSTPQWGGKFIRYFVSERWKKNSYKQTHGLCYTIANNAYCPKLADQFLAAGQSQEKWQTAVRRLQYLRELAKTKGVQATEAVKTAVQNPQNIQRLHGVARKIPKP